MSAGRSLTAAGARKVVAIGGGHGLARALAALRLLDLAPTAVVTVADDGGSSGRLRRDLGIIAPGDLRMALLTLARNQPLAAALEHRFERGQLEDHALGNLFLVALAEQQQGSFLLALRAAANLLDCQGEVLPSTTEPVQLHAQVGGRQVDGQVQVATARGRVERLWLEPRRPAACPDATAAIAAADVVLLGPGSLFTSIVANLCVPGIREAVAATSARIVHVANLRTQEGETSGLDLQGHAAALLDQLGGRTLDTVVVNDGDPGEGAGDPLGTHVGGPGVGKVVHAPLARADLPGHDPQRLAAVLGDLFG